MSGLRPIKPTTTTPSEELERGCRDEDGDGSEVGMVWGEVEDEDEDEDGDGGWRIRTRTEEELGLEDSMSGKLQAFLLTFFGFGLPLTYPARFFSLSFNF